MKKVIVLFTFLSLISWPTAFASPPAREVCGRVLRRHNPVLFRSDYRYDVVVNFKVLHWTSPKKYNIGQRMCV